MGAAARSYPLSAPALVLTGKGSYLVGCDPVAPNLSLMLKGGYSSDPAYPSPNLIFTCTNRCSSLAQSAPDLDLIFTGRYLSLDKATPGSLISWLPDPAFTCQWVLYPGPAGSLADMHVLWPILWKSYRPQVALSGLPPTCP